MSAMAAAIGGSVVSGLFNQRSANKQMRFQDTSSRTQYQRAVADMRAAGINPMLAAKLGGNSAMSGASATMPDLGATINSAQSLRQQKPVQDSQAALNRAQAKVANMTYSQIEAQIGQIMANTDNIEVRTELAKLNVREQRLLVTALEYVKNIDREAYLALKFSIDRNVIRSLVETSVAVTNAIPTKDDIMNFLKKAGPAVKDAIRGILE